MRMHTAVLLLTSVLAGPALAGALQDPLPSVLPRDHPAARLNPAYLGARPIEDRIADIIARSGPAGPFADAAVVYDMKTRKETRLPSSVMLRPAWFARPPAQKTEQFKGLTPSSSSDIAGLAGPVVNTVFGDEDRVPVEDTTAWPYRAVCKLYMYYLDGSVFICSGSMIGDKYVLTAGHCIWDGMSYPAAVVVVPGKQGDYTPYGEAMVLKVYSQVGWLRDLAPGYDFAVLTLDRRIGLSTGWMGYAYNPAIDNVQVETAGFPGDIDGGETMIKTAGPIVKSDKHELYFYVDIMGGQSGSAMWTTEGDKTTVVGIVAYESRAINLATRLEPTRFNIMKKFVGQKPSP